MITDSNGEMRKTTTSSFGFYKFSEVSAGATYIISVKHSRFAFNPSTYILTVLENMKDVNFTVE